MGKINLGRVILGGIVGGLVGDLLAFLVDGVWLGPQWASGMKALMQPNLSSSQLIWFNVLGLVYGVATIWIYAAIRPRFGAGAKTAVLAGLACWVLGALIPNFSFMWVDGLFSHRLMVMTTLGGVAEFVFGALAGAALYQESSS
jgi:hypothetical protein